MVVGAGAGDIAVLPDAIVVADVVDAAVVVVLAVAHGSAQFVPR